MTVDIEQDKALTVQETAEFLSTSEECVLGMIARNEIAASNIQTKPNAVRPRWRILASDLGKFLARTRLPVVENKAATKRAKPVAKDYFA